MDQILAACESYPGQLSVQKSAAAEYLEAEFLELESLLRKKREEAFAELNAVEERKNQENIRFVMLVGRTHVFKNENCPFRSSREGRGNARDAYSCHWETS